MPISKKPIQQQGVQMRQENINGSLTPALVFNFSQGKQAMGAFICFVLAVCSAIVFYDAQNMAKNIGVSVVGIRLPMADAYHNIAIQAFSMFGVIFMLVFMVLAILRLFKAPIYMALTPKGIYLSQVRPPLFIEWNYIKRLLYLEHRKSRGVGFVISDLESKEALRPFYKRMKSKASFSGAHWAVMLGPFVAPPELTQLSIELFFEHPEKRALLGTEESLRELASAAGIE